MKENKCSCFQHESSSIYSRLYGVEAKKMADNGHTVDEILSRSEYLRDHFCGYCR